ncbi:MAG: hypothetical protein C5B43_04475 [Verrucomicrobia bacterium]|nr:MAG: hypothetical protein C5B43_04475 [Verrucomicrobiota bacterium]
MNRKKILNHLIHFDLPLNEVQNQLNEYEWNSEILIVLEKKDLILILKKYLNDLISKEELELWANMIESRDDIGCGKSDFNLIKEIVFIIANPSISMKLTKTNVIKILEKLES